MGLQVARALSLQGFPLLGVLCRSQESRQQAAQILPQHLVFQADSLGPPVGRVLLAVRDREIAEAAALVEGVMKPGAVLLHCSGALGPQVLAPLAERGFRTGVWHPFLAFPHPVDPPVAFRGAVVTLAGDPEAVAAGRELAEALGMVPVPVGDLNWPLYHAAATLAGPLVFALLQAAQQELCRANFPPEAIPRAIASLAGAVVGHATSGRGWGLLTGPAVRGDRTTIEAHEAVLNPDVGAVYRALTRYVVTRSRERHDPAADTG